MRFGMHRALHLGLLVAVFCVCACASHKQPGAAFAAGDGSGGGSYRVGTSQAKDAGIVRSTVDAGSPLTAVQYFTIAQGTAPVDAGVLGFGLLDASAGNGVVGLPASAQITSPSDFHVGCLGVAWSGACPSPELALLIASGACPNGDGHQLALLISSFAHIGQNAVFPEPDSTGIRVRYLRPSSLVPAGTWGTCAGSSGQFVISSTPSDPGSSRLTATFSLDLGQCGADAGIGVGQTIEGSFDVPVVPTLRSLCP